MSAWLLALLSESLSESSSAVPRAFVLEPTRKSWHSRGAVCIEALASGDSFTHSHVLRLCLPYPRFSTPSDQAPLVALCSSSYQTPFPDYVVPRTQAPRPRRRTLLCAFRLLLSLGFPCRLLMVAARTSPEEPAIPLEREFYH